MFSSKFVTDYVFKKSGVKLTRQDDIWPTLKEFGDLLKRRRDLAPALIGPLPDRSTGATAFNSNDFSYLVGGVFHANILYREMRKVLGDKTPLDILDFGFGAMRILRYFRMFAPEHRYHACEVNAACLRHARQIAPRVDARMIASHPPSSFADESMDAVYAWSIWTHFDEPTGRAWLEDLHRILRPGGCALITVHTDELVERYGTEPNLVRKMKDRGGDYEKIRAEYDATGFSYWLAYPDDAKLHGIDNETFGMTFSSLDYIKRNWTDLFDFIGSCEAAPKWQDVIVLRKK